MTTSKPTTKAMAMAVIGHERGWASQFGVAWMIAYERWSMWEKLRKAEGVTLEFRRPGPLPHSTLVEFIRYPEEVGRRLDRHFRALWDEEDIARLGYLGIVEEPPRDPRLMEEEEHGQGQSADLGGDPR